MSTNVPDSWEDDEEVAQVEPPLSAKPTKAKKQKVKDDWDDDEDEEDDQQTNAAGIESASHSQEINKYTQIAKSPSKPASSSSLAIGSSFPPELSFEPAVRILKRPKPTGPQSSGTSTNSERQTLQEREEKYRLARERIFGSSPGSSSPNDRGSPVSRSLTPVNSSNVSRIERSAGPSTPDYARPTRDPLGPGSQTAFMRRSAPGRPGSASLSQDA